MGEEVTQEIIEAPEADVSVADEAEAHLDESRSAAMDRIHENRLKMLKEEGFNISNDEAADSDEEIDDEPAPEETKTADDEPAPEVVKAEPELHDVIIDGKPAQVTQDELVRSYQIRAAADSRLEQATLTLQQAQQQAQAVQQAATQIPEQQKESTTDLPDDLDLDGLVENMQFGDPKEAAAQLKTLIETLRSGDADATASVTPEEIDMRVSARLDENEWNDALTKFNEEYSDIVNDPILGAVTGQTGRALLEQAVQQAAATGQRRPNYIDVFRVAGEQTKEWVKNRFGEQAPENKSDDGVIVNLDKSRQDAKKTSVQPPTPRAATSIPRNKATTAKPQTTAEIVEEMRKARHQ